MYRKYQIHLMAELGMRHKIVAFSPFSILANISAFAPNSSLPNSRHSTSAPLFRRKRTKSNESAGRKVCKAEDLNSYHHFSPVKCVRFFSAKCCSDFARIRVTFSSRNLLLRLYVYTALHYFLGHASLAWWTKSRKCPAALFLFNLPIPVAQLA